MKKAFLMILLLFLCYFALSTSALALAPDLQSEAAVLMDGKTGQILWAQNMDAKEYPASITKILTAYLAVEMGSTDEVLTMSRNAVFSIPRGSSHIALDEGEAIVLKDALAALMTVSANDVANGIAEYFGGSIEHFAKMMNDKAVSLGAKDSNFLNPSGLSDDNHYTTAHDMAVITYNAIKNPVFLDFFAISSYTMPPTNKQSQERFFNNQHHLIYEPKAAAYDYPGIIGGKLGWTKQAKNTMVTVAQRDGRTLIAVVMNCPSAEGKYTDTLALFDYGFKEFKPHTFSAASINSFLKQEGKNASVDKDLTVLVHDNMDISAVKMVLSDSERNGDLKVDFLWPQEIIDNQGGRDRQDLSSRGDADEGNGGVLEAVAGQKNNIYYSQLASLSIEGKRPLLNNFANGLSEDKVFPSWLKGLLIGTVAFGGLFFLLMVRRQKKKAYLRQIRRNRQESLEKALLHERK